MRPFPYSLLLLPTALALAPASWATTAAQVGIPAPPVKVASWVGSARPASTHTSLLLAMFRSTDDTTPRVLRRLARMSTQNHIRALALDVIDKDPAAPARLRRLHASIPVGQDAPINGAGLGQTASQWLPLVTGVDLPVAFLVSNGRIIWYGNLFQAPDFQSWIGSRAEKRFWQAVADRQADRQRWASHPLKQRVDRISALIADRKFDGARHEIEVLARMPKTDWLDPVKFAPYLRLSVAEHERNIGDFYVAARAIADAHESDGPMLNEVAWKIVDPQSRIPRRDWQLAVRLARQATRLAPTTAGAYDTLGWALYGARQTQAAIRAERSALWFSVRPEDASRCRNALLLFEKSPR